MLIIVDDRISQEAKKKLAHYGEILGLRTEGITYPAISGHPDIFFCQAPGKLFVAPNLPGKYFEKLKEHSIDYLTGELPAGPEYPASTRYNAVATEKYLIHNFRHTDFVITRTLEDLQLIHVDQGYCRCNLLPLKNDHFITSDPGIYRVLKELQHNDNKTLFQRSMLNDQGSMLNLKVSAEQVLFVSTSDILLEGFPHGFFGGCCGVWDNKVFVNGSLSHFPEGSQVREYLASLGYAIVELDEGPLTDVGSIFFVDESASQQ